VTPGSGPEPGGKHILLVDDSEDAAEGLALRLKMRGYVVCVAYDGPSALHAVRDFRPVVALLDIGLPEMDGYELAEKLHAVPGLEQLRCVAVTGFGQASDRARSRAAGFHAHIVKPADFDSILRAIEE
jgi:CheY-like chemotaxis protein